MKNIIENVNALLIRKHTHIASIDVEAMESKIVTIKKCIYAEDVDVNGKPTDGLFIEFVEPIKDMVVNTINKATIIKIVQQVKGLTFKEAIMTSTWSNVKIELYVKDNVKMRRSLVKGIRVKPQSPIPSIDPKEAIELLETSSDLDSLKLNWSKLSKQEQSLPEVVALKDKIKLTFE